MRSIKKITAVYLFIVLGVGLATKPRWALVEETEHEIHVVSEYPKVGEVFEVVYRVRLKPEIKPEYGQRNFYIKFFTGSSFKAEVLDTNEIIVPSLIPGKWQEFRGQFRIPKPYNMVFVNTSIHYEGVTHNLAGASLRLYLIDSLTGQYGTKEAYDKQLWQKAEWWYDPAGEFTDDPVHLDCAKKNREIITRLQEIEPELTDWEALYLHYDGIQALMGGMGTYETKDEERWRFLLESGWLKQQRAEKQAKEKWLKDLIEKYKGKPLTKE